MGRIGLIFLGLVLTASACARGGEMSSKDDFDSSRAHVIEIRLSSEAWDALQPGGATKKAAAKAGREGGRTAGVRLRPNGSGYAYVMGEMEFDGKKIAEVGLRFKGNSSYAVSAGA